MPIIGAVENFAEHDYKGGGLVVRVGKWGDAYGGLNVGDSRTSSERIVAELIAHRTPCSDF